MKSTQTLLSLALFLTSTAAFATLPAIDMGSGVYFYAWNANAHCSTTNTITNPTGRCPELWTDTIKNINAQVPASSNRAQIKFVYLDSVTLNLPAAPITKTIFTVGGCSDSTDIVFCSRSGGLTYSDPQSESGYQAVSDLNTALGSSYYVMPMVSAAGDTSLESLNANQLESLAYSLACIVNPNATPPAGLTNGPSACSAVLTGTSLNPTNLTPTISGLAFDIEGPDLSSHKNADPYSAGDFYGAVQTAIGASSSQNPKFIMVSRGPNGLNEAQDGNKIDNPTQAQISLTFGTVLNTLNQNSNLVTFIFSPQIYDLCDGMGTWACPVTTPYTPTGTSTPTYAQSLFLQPIPADTADGNGWDANDILFQKFSAPYQFFNQLNGHSIPTPALYPNVPVQPSISAGASSQIWSHVNLYNADSTKDPFLLGVPVYSGAPVSFQPSMIYQNKKACQAENADGTLGATIPNCVTYPNPYGETIASYASTLFATLQNSLSANNSSSVFSGVTLYPFTPYGFFDNACASKTVLCQGYFPEAPDGLVNGQKPQISFWKIYLNQFADQWIGSTSGTIPTQTTLATPALFLTFPTTGYYSLNSGTATINFGTATYPTGGNINNISGYRANLIDAIGNTVASGTCASSTCTQIQISNAPGGNYVLEVQALDLNNHVIASTEAAANAPGAPSAPQISINIQNAKYINSTSYSVTWQLNCTTSPANLSSISTAAVTGPGPRTSLSMVAGADRNCGRSVTEIFNTYAGYTVSPGAQVSVFLVNSQFQAISAPQSGTLSN